MFLPDRICVYLLCNRKYFKTCLRKTVNPCENIYIIINIIRIITSQNFTHVFFRFLKSRSNTITAQNQFSRVWNKW